MYLQFIYNTYTYRLNLSFKKWLSSKVTIKEHTYIHRRASLLKILRNDSWVPAVQKVIVTPCIQQPKTRQAADNKFDIFI